MSPARTDPVLELRLLGGFEARLGQQAIAGLGSQRLRSLLVYLIARRHAPQARRHLAMLLWPDSPEAQARNNLRQLLHSLRSALPEPERFLDIGVRDVRWRLDAPAEIDAVRFEKAIERAQANPMQAALVAAAGLYGGDLLPGCYDEWIVDERERLRSRNVWVLERLMAIAEESGDYAAGIGAAQHLLHLDPLHEEGYRSLMRLYAEAGDRARALRVYHRCASVLADDLGVEPSAETQRLHRALVDLPGRDPGDRSLATNASATPLAGRTVAWDRLHDAWTSTAEGPARLVIVTGEAGVGKTRLVDELLAWCARRGVLTAKARAYAAEGRLPYAPVVDLVRSNAIRPYLSGLDAAHAGELARLLPELPAAEDPVAISKLLTDEEQRRRLFDALARALLAPGTPTLLVLDDLQWADGETIAFLHYLVRSESAAQVMIAATVRDDEVGPDHPLAAVLASLRGIDALYEISLGPLDRQDVRTVAETMAMESIDDAVAERLFRESEGNPLFLIEMIRAGFCAETRAGTGLPPRVQSVIAGRLDHLSGNARELVGVAAVLGREFTFELVARTSGLAEDVVVDAIDELWQRRLFKEQGTDAYDFTHDKIRDVAYSTIPPARRRRIHRDAARALEALHEQDLDRVAASLAAHYEKCGLREQALACYERAISVARHVFADEEVIAMARRALTLVDHLPRGPERDGQELSLLMSLGVALFDRHGVSDEFQAVYDRARALCLRHRGQVDPPILRVNGSLAIVQRRFPDAYARGAELLKHWQRNEDRVARVEGHYLIGAAEFWMGYLKSGRQNLEQALAHYRRERAREHIESFAQDPGPVCLSRVGSASWYLGELDHAFELHDQALVDAEELGHPYSVGYVLTMDAWLSAEAGEVGRLRERLDRIEALELPNAWVECMKRALQGWIQVLDGDVPPGISMIRHALDGVLASGQLVAEPLFRLLLARACAIGGDARVGLHVLEHAPRAFTDEMPFHATEFHRLRGELLAACGEDPAAVAAAFRQAVATAQQQQAMTLELRARTSLVRWLIKTTADGTAGEVQELQELLSRFTQGLNRPDLLDAATVLRSSA